MKGGTYHLDLYFSGFDEERTCTIARYVKKGVSFQTHFSSFFRKMFGIFQ
jgi:membrane-anchored protein YejM (alkaline phosphatase superfamily)